MIVFNIYKWNQINVSCFKLLSSERKVVMSTFWWGSVFSFKNFKRVHNSCSCLTWHNNSINITSFSCLQWVSKLFFVAFSFLFWVLSSKNNLNSSFSSHYCYFCRWPSIVKISFKMFWRHNIISSTICFSSYKCYFRYWCFCISVK